MTGEMIAPYYPLEAEIEKAEGHLRVGCLYSPPLPEEGAVYFDYIGRLLDSQPRMQSSLEPIDLLLHWVPDQRWWQRWLGLTPVSRLVDRSNSSVLAARKPRWPLRRILLILRAHEEDEAAIQWLGRLARPAQAEVFVLPIIPPLPGMYSHGSLPLDAEVILAPNTFSGSQLRRLASLCAAWGMEGRLMLQESEPQQRIKRAAETSDCDLIILSDEPYHWIHRQLLGELVQPLLHNSDRPVLIAKDVTGGRYTSHVPNV